MTSDEFKKELGTMRRDADDFAKSFGRGLHDSLTDFIVDGEGRFKDLLRRMAAEVAVSGIFNAISGGLSGSTSGIGKFFGKLFGGARANGGPVSAGSSYLVGERGPELFTPKAAGSIIPNGSGGGVHVHINAPIYADDAIGVRRAIEQGMRDAVAASAMNTAAAFNSLYRPTTA
jgi:phage-related minor tail protein